MQEHTYHSDQTSDLFEDEILVYASFGDRFGAALLDLLILIIPNIVLQVMAEDHIWGDIVSIVVSWLYASLMESGEGQATIGKKALGIKVVNMEGQRISFGQATGRFFSKYVSAIILFIGYFMMLWSDKKQTLHDMMAGTLVVKGNA